MSYELGHIDLQLTLDNTIYTGKWDLQLTESDKPVRRQTVRTIAEGRQCVNERTLICHIARSLHRPLVAGGGLWSHAPHCRH